MKITSYIVFFSLLLPFTGALAAPHNRRLPLESFSNRKSVERKFGKTIASQLPGYFDFRRYKLVFIPRDYNEGATLELFEPKIRANLKTRQYDGFGWIDIDLFKRKALISVVSDDPCSGGIEKPHEVYMSCLEGQKQRREESKNRIRLYAFRKTVRVTGFYVEAPPRP